MQFISRQLRYPICGAAYLDKNHDGLISPQELSEALAESQIMVSGATLSQLMNEEDYPGRQQPEGPMLTKEGFAVCQPALIL